MYRNFVAQHGYEPIGSEPRECIAPAVLNMVTMFSTSEPRKVQYRKFMYRAFGTQHGYDTQQHRKIVLPKSLIS